MAMTKTSRATAIRDMGALVEYGCLVQIQSVGRNVHYELLF